jgi:hypothetical protein
VTRRFRRILRIRRSVALALAVTAVAAPAAVADTPVGSDQLSIHARHGGAAVDHVTPDARDAGRPAPAIDLVSPDARDNGRRGTPPAVSSAPTVAASDHFDWLDAGVGAAGLAALLLLGGTAAVVRTRRGPVRAA